jgi:phage shock protein PspC (stress-responsive transcriptional regulator)
MKKVIMINLNGKAYQIEESGYEVLTQYLHKAERKLAHDPDKREILADFEQAIGEKCDQYVTGRKTVVTSEEVEKIVTDMGPVEADEEEHEKAHQSDDHSAYKRLFLIREGAILGGVCTGLGAYFNIDANVVRLLFIVFAFITSGLGILVYVLMMLFLPEATTPEERAQAHGERFVASDLLDRAKAKYNELSSKEHWERVSDTTAPAFSQLGEGLARLGRAVIQLCLAITTLCTMVVAIVWIATLWAIISTNRIAGYTIDPHFSRFLFALWDTTGFFILLLPLVSLCLLFLHALHSERAQRLHRWGQYGLMAGWIFSIALFVAIPLSQSNQIRNVADGHNQELNFGNKSYCVEWQPNETHHVWDLGNTERCQ